MLRSVMPDTLELLLGVVDSHDMKSRKPSLCPATKPDSTRVTELILVTGEFSQGAVGHHGLILRRLLHHVYVPVEVDYITGDIYRDARSGFARRKPYEDGGEILVRVPDEKAFTG